MPFTTCQTNAFNAIVAWLNTPHTLNLENNIFVLSGAAGTGKTYLLDNLLEFVQVQDDLNISMGIPSIVKGDNIHFTATTNNAVNLLTGATTLKNPPKTIHSFLGLRVIKDFATGKSYIPYNNLKIDKDVMNGLIVIDEASMLERKFLESLVAASKNIKILLVGDYAQLPPVKEDKPYFMHMGFAYYDMIDNVRSANSPDLQVLLNNYRQSIQNNKPYFNLNCKDVFCLTNSDFVEQLKAAVLNGENVKYLAYTNSAVNSCNSHIKKFITGSAEIQQGQVLVNFSVPHDSGLKVLSELYVHKVSDTKYTSKYLTTTVKGKLVNGTYFVANTLKENTDFMAELRKLFSHNVNSDVYAEIVKAESVFLDARPEYALTINRSQGQSYNDVYIDLNTINCIAKTKKMLATRLLYVALSRARNNVYITGNLAL